MSGLAAIWQLDGAQVDPSAFDWLLSTLSHRGIDGQSTWRGDAGSLALGHFHFWTTPEEVGERQPVVRGDVALMLDGRLDNREELAGALDIWLDAKDPMSDAALALHAFERWGDDLPNRLKGPFALVAWDGRRRQLLCARDPIGRRTLFHRRIGDALIVASEPGALLRAEEHGNAELDEVFLAHFFALRPAPEGRTLYTSVRELRPGHVLKATGDGMHLERYWSLTIEPIRYRSTDDYAERFVELLDRAVARRMRAPSPPAVMMSGGLDSTSVAALAARQLEAGRPGQRLDVYSYVFDEMTELDERQWMAPMVAAYGLNQTTVVADDAWPLSDFDDWRWNANGPQTHGFRALNERVYSAARKDGQRVLLSGGAADALFLYGHESWLADLIGHGHLTEAATEIIAHARKLGPLEVVRSRSVRRLGARLVGRRGRSPAAPTWLSRFAADKIVARQEQMLIRGSRRRSEEINGLLETISGSGVMDARYSDHRSQVEVRDPFTDADVVAYVLAIPAYLLYNRGRVKYLQYRAMLGLLPEEVIQRAVRSDISPLFERGLVRGTGRLEEQRWDSPECGAGHYVRTFRNHKSNSRSATECERTLELVSWYSLMLNWWLSLRPSDSMDVELT